MRSNMKKFFLIITLFVGLTTFANSQMNAGVSFGVFYSSLSHYGEWIELQPDVYAWRPLHMHHDWRPYMDGRWEWTNDGWFWVSYEPFGWATFHYGRWYYDDYYGWIWMPGYDWAPAWVEWRYDDDYIGWSPLPPYATFNINIGIHFTTRWAAPLHYWSFVRYRHFCDPRVGNYYEPAERTRRFFGNTRSRSDYSYERDRIINRGVEREFIERRGGERIRTAEITETRDRQTERVVREGERPRIEVYRPRNVDVERSRPERIEARKADRGISLDMNKVDRSSYQERNQSQEPRNDRDVVGRERNIENRPTDRNIQGRETLPQERKIDERKYEPRKRSDRYQQLPEIKREDRREYQNKQRDAERRQVQPERRERQIEIQREQVKPREFREQPRQQEKPKNEGQREDRKRERPGRRD
jgi:hypothetical protein